MMGDTPETWPEVGDEWDVVVVGAGPAGALAAYLLARMSLKTLLVEKESFPRHKVCGGCLNTTSLSVLEAVGLGHIWDDISAPHTAVARLACGGHTARIAIRPGRAVSRGALDAALAAAAEAAGAVFLDTTSATVLAADHGDATRSIRLLRRSGRIRTITTKVALVADGLGHPSLNQLLDFRVSVAQGSRIGLGAIVPNPRHVPRPNEITMAVGRHGYVGSVVVENGQLNVAAALDASELKRRGARRTVDSILADAGIAIHQLSDCRWRGTRPLTCRAAPVAGHRVFLLGDATGYVEPFTGQGMAWALSSSTQLAPLVRRACEAWRDEYVRAWTQSHQSRWAAVWRICRGMQPVLRRPRLTRSLVTLLDWCPQLATPLTHHIARPSPNHEAFS